MRNWLLLNFIFSIFLIPGSFSTVRASPAPNKRSNFLNGFSFQRTVSISQKACSCPTVFSCACCQRVTIVLRGVATMLCANFNYGQTGLSMNVTLGSQVVRQVSIVDYRAFKVCTSLPDCRYSFVCIDVMEVSQFPRSITICVQLDIMSKHEHWLVNYNCISVSTVLPTSTTTTTLTPSTTNIVLNGSTGMMQGMPTTTIPGTGQMPQNSTGMLMPMPGGSGGQPAQNMTTGGMPPGTPGQMPPAGQMPPPGQMPPAGQMPPPAQMQRTVNEKDQPIVSRSIRTVSEAYDLPPIRKLRKSTDASMKMQVILRHRKSRLPKIVSDFESTESFRASVKHHVAVSRSSRIVNQNTASIPMPVLGAGSVLGPDATALNNAFPSSINGGFVDFLPPPSPQFPPPQPIPDSPPSYGLSVPRPVFVLEDVPREPIPMKPIAPNFFINYDNRTSSFPDRIPPGFGVSSRIGPNKNDEKKSVTSFERSVEELETVRPEIKLPPNSKIIETTTADSGNGNIVFPE